MRLPVRPGDLTVFVLFGDPPADTPMGPSEEASATLRHEAIVAGLTCTMAVTGWIGLCAGAFVAGPVGWVMIGLVAFDGIANGVASISCLESGVRVVNESRGRHNRNVAMDANPAYAVSSRVQDGIGLATVPRAALTAIPKVVGVASEAAAAARGVAAAATSTRVLHEIFLSKEVRIELLNAVGSVIGAVGSGKGGLLRELADAFPTFTIAVTN